MPLNTSMLAASDGVLASPSMAPSGVSTRTPAGGGSTVGPKKRCASTACGSSASMAAAASIMAAALAARGICWTVDTAAARAPPS